MALGARARPDYGAAHATTRALRILADHSRAMTFLIADGVVPSNEDRGYILRRVMRRAIQQGHRIGIERGFLPRFAEPVIELMGAALPRAASRSATRSTSGSRAEEESFGRTLEQGTKLLDDLLERAARPGIGADDAFQLHDTFGFPFDLTREIAAERGVPFADEAELRAADGASSAPALRGGRGRRRSGATAETVRGAGLPSRPRSSATRTSRSHTVVAGRGDRGRRPRAS